MSIDDIEHCVCRESCPLKLICGTTKDVHEKPLLPAVSKIEKGELLWSNLRFENHVHVIQDGVFVSMGHTEQEKEIPFALFGRGIAIGIAELYAPAELSNTYHIRNLLPGKVCSISTSAIKQKLEAIPGSYVHRMLSCALTNQCASAFTQTKIIAQQSLYYRILSLLKHLSDLTSRVGVEQTSFSMTHEEIAMLVFSDRVSTTRVLHKMRDDGLIGIGYRSVTLHVNKLEDSGNGSRAHTDFVVPEEGPELIQYVRQTAFSPRERDAVYAVH